MGLDSHWTTPGGKELTGIKFDPPLNLCGGMISGHGDGSFRGKVYNDLIEQVTRETLYQEVIENDVVREMARKLEEEPYRPGEMDCTLNEWQDLQRMFKTYAEAGAVLRGWW